MNRDPDDRAHPDGAPVDDEFEAIVAEWRREGRVPVWPDERDPAVLFEPSGFDPLEPDPGSVDTGQPEPGGSRPGGSEPGGAEPDRHQPGLFEPASPRPARRPEEEHFVPPEPPPLPRLGPPAVIGMALLGTGLLLLVSPGLLGVADRYGLPLGLVGVAAGLGWLVLRLWPDPPLDEHPDRDDGAVL